MTASVQRDLNTWLRTQMAETPSREPAALVRASRDRYAAELERLDAVVLKRFKTTDAQVSSSLAVNESDVRVRCGALLQLLPRAAA